MKLYDYPGAPNPRRVKIFAAEKGLTLELEHTDLRERAQKSAGFLKKNASGKIPVLELDDGTCIGESIAICRYLEHVQPEPNLFGQPGVEAAIVEMHQRQIELELQSQIGTAWVNGPIVAKMGLIKPIEAARERAATLTHQFYQRLDEELSSRPFIAGERYTVVDITTVVAIDFATALVDLKPAEDLAHLWDWHSRVSARPAVAAPY